MNVIFYVYVLLTAHVIAHVIVFSRKMGSLSNRQIVN